MDPPGFTLSAAHDDYVPRQATQGGVDLEIVRRKTWELGKQPISTLFTTFLMMWMAGAFVLSPSHDSSPLTYHHRLNTVHHVPHAVRHDDICSYSCSPRVGSDVSSIPAAASRGPRSDALQDSLRKYAHLRALRRSLQVCFAGHHTHAGGMVCRQHCSASPPRGCGGVS